MSSVAMQVIDLNVGGTRYTTSHSTLTKYPKSMLGAMFSGRYSEEAMKHSDGSFFIDRDGTHFRHILNYLRDGENVIKFFPRSPEALQELLHEAQYYQLEDLVTALQTLGKIVLDVGGTRYTTSRSTLTKYPESMLGVMFSGRHDIEAMECSDGSFFIDRDGVRFKYILEYLREGEKAVKRFPKSAEIVLGLYHDAEFYQLKGLATALHPLMRDVDEVCFKDVFANFNPDVGSYCADGSSYDNPVRFQVERHSIRAISFQHKSLRGLCFNAIRFDHPLSFTNCNLSGSSFTNCCFESNVIFKDCILDDTVFSCVKGLLSSFSFNGCKIDKAKFDDGIMKKLKSNEIITRCF